MKKVLILNGTISEIPIIKIAQNMGFYVVTTGNMPNLPGHKIADEYIPADYSNCEEVLKLVKDNDIEGIISCANDFGVITSSYVAEQMGWPGHDTYEHSLTMHHKDKLMTYFKDHQIPAPWFEIFEQAEDAKHFCETCKYPIIVKANDLTGGKGILRANTIEEAKLAVDNAFNMSRDKHVLIEPFLTGIQQSIVVFLIDGKIVQTSSSDIFCMRNPYLVQAETYPATDFDKVKGKLHAIIHQMAEDMKLVDGIFSFQYIVEDDTPYIIDMMRRCFGNETLLLADEMTGFPWEEAYVRASLGMDCKCLTNQPVTTKYCGHYGVMAEQNGELVSYEIPEDILNRLFKHTVNMQPGDVIDNYMTEKIAHIYFRYDDFEQMKDEIVKYNDRITVNVRG